MTDRLVMVDIETLSTEKNAVILSIGAVKFGKTINDDTFYRVIDIESCVDAGLHIDPSTIQWWKQQSDEARSIFSEPSIPLRQALVEYSEWCPRDPEMWGNGSPFDNVIIESAYKALGMKTPWKFWNDRCYRTIAAISGTERIQEGTHHNALDDAISQAKHLMKILNYADA